MFALRYMKIRQTTKMSHQIRKHSMYHRGVHDFIKKNLLLINSFSSGGCMFLGDLMQQEFEYQSNLLSARYNWARLARMTTVGMVMGPLHHFYYVYLDVLLPKVTVKTVFMKIGCDQICASPLTLLCFYILVGLFEGKSYEDAKEEIRRKFLYTYMGDCLFWPPIQFINFYFLPTHYRVVYINVATAVFNVFLSYMKHFDNY